MYLYFLRLVKSDYHVILFSLYVFLSRFFLLSGLPMTDEGFYEFYAQYFHHSLTKFQVLPYDGPLMLYSLLFSWGFCFDFNHIIFYRIIDLIFSLLAANLFFFVNLYFSKSKSFSFFTSILFSDVFVNPIYIDNGFKNPITIGLFFLFLGFLVFVKANVKNSKILFALSGSFLCLSFLFRESLLFPALVFLATFIYMTRDKKNLWFLFFGFIGSFFIVFIGVSFLRGGAFGIINSYINMSDTFNYASIDKLQLFKNSFYTFFKNSWYGLFLFFSIVFISRLRHLKLDSLSCFLVVFLLVLFIEPCFKIAFPYHFSITLVGFSFCFSCFFNRLNIDKNIVRSKTNVFFILGIAYVILYLYGMNLKERIAVARSVLSEFNDNKWPSFMIENSNYLKAAEMILKYKSDNTTLSVSGFMYTLYPLTGLLPPDILVSNLTDSLYMSKLNVDKFNDKIKYYSPDLVFTVNRSDWIGGDILNDYFLSSLSYKKIDSLSVSPYISYGSWSGDLFINQNR